MSKSAGALCLLFAGCVTGGVGANRESAAHAAPRFEMTAAVADTPRVFPVAIDPQLPTADRMRREIRTELGEVASADVRLCVAPDGHVRNVEIVRGSTLAEFDQAILHDMAHWQFSGMPGSSHAENLQSCEIATITYRPHS
jgi:TonB family protein